MTTLPPSSVASRSRASPSPVPVSAAASASAASSGSMAKAGRRWRKGRRPTEGWRQGAQTWDFPRRCCRMILAGRSTGKASAAGLHFRQVVCPASRSGASLSGRRAPVTSRVLPASDPHPHVGARRVLDRLQLARRRAGASSSARVPSMRLDPGLPVVPPGARPLLRRAPSTPRASPSARRRSSTDISCAPAG